MPTSEKPAATELDRLFMALAARTQIEAADMLGVRQSVLSDSKRRGGVVTGDLLKTALTFGVSLEWITQVKPPMRIDEAGLEKKCRTGRYCLERCPALDALQQALRLASHCQYICGACEHNAAASVKTP